MAKGDNRKAVTISFGTDKASLEAALRDIERLAGALNSLGGGRGSSSNQAPMPGAINAPAPPISFGPGGTFSGTPSSGLNYGGGGGSYSSPLPTMISYVPSITIQNAQNVTITGTNVNFSGGGGGGGGGGPVDPGSTPSPGNPRGQTMYGMIMSMLGGGGMAQSLATLVNAAGVISPYAIPAAIVHAIGSGRSADYAGSIAIGQYNTGLALGQSQGQFYGPAEIAHRQVLEQQRISASTRAYAGPAWNIADFASFGEMSRGMQTEQRSGELMEQLLDAKGRSTYLGRFGYNSGYKGDFEAGEVFRGAKAKGVSNIKYAEMVLEKYGNDYRTAALADQGWVGLATDSSFSSRFLPSTSPDAKFYNQALMSGGSRALGRLDPIARAAAAFGLNNQGDALTRSGALSGLLSGDYGLDFRGILGGKGGMSDSAIENLGRLGAQITQRVEYGQNQSSFFGAQSSYFQAIGRGPEEISALMGQSAGQLQLVSEDLSMKASLMTGPGMELERQRLNLQSMQVAAQAAQMRKQQSQYPYQFDQGLFGTRAGTFSARAQLTAYEGGSMYDNTNYGKVGKSLGQVTKTIREKMNDPNVWSKLNAQEKESMRMELAQAELAEVEQQRSVSGIAYGENSSFIALSRAERQTGVMRAGLFGSSKQQFSAAQTQLSSIDEQIAAEKEYLNSVHTLTEKNQILANIRNLQNQRESENEMSYRQLYQSDIGMSQARSGAFGAIGSRQTLFGGSVAAVGSSLSMSSEAGVRATRSKQEYDRLAAIDPNGNETQLAYTRWQQALAERDMSYAGTSYAASPGLRREAMNLDVQMAINSRTFAGYGDVRGSYEAGLKNVGKQLGELSSQREKVANKMRADGYSREQIDAAMLGIDDQAKGLVMQGVGYQQALESGWMERLISEHYNAGGNYNLVASSFTKRNSVMFGGVVNRYFGATGQQANQFRRQGQMLMNSFSGIMNRPEGFLESAMSGSGAGDGSINLGGVIKLEITLKDSSGKKLTDTQEHVNINNQTFTASFKQNKGIMTG